MQNSTKQNENSCQFTGGWLQLRKNSSEIEIRGWDPPTARRRSPVSPEWEPFVPEFQLVRPYRKKKQKSGLSEKEKAAGQMTFDFFAESAPPKVKKAPPTLAEQKKKALDSFRFSLPKDVAKALEPFRVRQWKMLQMMHYDQGTIDLALANPALAFFLAQKFDGDVELIKSLQCSKMRQRELLKLLNYPDSNAAVKLISKIQPASITADNWKSMIKMVGSELAKDKTALGHVSKINLGVMEIVVDPIASAAAGAKLLEAVANDHREKYRGRVVHMIRSALDMQEDIQVGRTITFFHDLQRLYDVHERVTNQYKRRVRQLNDAELAAISGTFQDPPLPGIPGKIEPLICPRDLVDEGEIQGNCVASYARKIMTGKLYIYRVFGPQRATLSIVKKKRGWEIGELEARYNVAASKSTEDFVTNWLDQHQASRL